MRSSVLILFFILASSLSVAMEPGTEANGKVVSDVQRISECFSISSQCPDYLATETVQPCIPTPMRALRKSPERFQRSTSEITNLGYGQHASFEQWNHAKFVIFILPGKQSVMPSHNTDYLKFGLLLI